MSFDRWYLKEYKFKIQPRAHKRPDLLGFPIQCTVHLFNNGLPWWLQLENPLTSSKKYLSKEQRLESNPPSWKMVCQGFKSLNVTPLLPHRKMVCQGIVKFERAPPPEKWFVKGLKVWTSPPLPPPNNGLSRD